MIKDILQKSPIGLIFYTRKFISGEKKIHYQKRFIKFDIKDGWKVLDIGSGGEPFPFANFLTDRYPGKTQHRYNKLKTNNLPFAVSDVQNLPYKNKVFDFVYCAHVIEHVDDPAKACEEMMRVGKSGYIEVPTKTSDIIFNFARLNHFHKWHISKAGNSLIFIEYSGEERRDTGDQEIFYMAHSKLSNPVRKTYRANKDLYTNMFLWNNSFNYYIFDKNGNLISSNAKLKI